ncbi:hypothetical protein FRC12_018709 [Ceratobasidium sp. 428]|nr:hypothetical protein FRC12_018709 [Ceratobasidium sp. 428]
MNNQNNLQKSSWKDLVASVPELEELEIERQKLEPEHFALFALHLPKLRRLTFDSIYLDDVEPYNRTKDGTTVHSIALCGCIFLKVIDAPLEETILNAARYIFGLWPHATCEFNRTTITLRPRARKAMVIKLNAALRTLKLAAE